MKRIRNAAVLGAGTMGAQIAAHLANAGVPTWLLDVSAEAARTGLERARKIKPDPFYTRDTHRLVRTGSFENLDGLARCDWIVEAIVEQLEAKQALLERVEEQAGDRAILTSNTSGIPLSAIAAGRSDTFRRRWLGTHFFNPPRYLPLLEVIPIAETAPDATETIATFADRRLGKGVVVAKDTPGFIANRIGIYGLMQVFRAMAAGGFTVEEVDAITGPAIGRPKSATFRTMDLAGLDVFAQVTRGLGDRLNGDDRAAFEVPPVIDSLLQRGSLGAKTGSGFYRREASGDILALDLATLDYRPQQRLRLGSLDAARSIQVTAERIRTLFLGKDRVGEFLRATLPSTLLYAARSAPDISHSPADVDRALQWGFGWEIGPFATLQAIGADNVIAALPPDLQASAAAAFHRDAFDTADKPATWRPVPLLGRRGSTSAPHAVVRRNAGATLLDVGDGVLCLEFHSKMNAIGGDTIQMLQLGITEASENFAALVVGNQAEHFSAGANLMLLLLEAQEGNWEEVDLMVRTFQQSTMALKHAAVPVVVAPAGLTLGGGCEIALHAARVQAAGETYMGLVEVGVGLIPAGGGTKEMLARATEHLPASADPLPFVQQVFETIGFAAVSTSGADARRLGFLRGGDGVTMNRDRLLADAKQVALGLVPGYVPAQARADVKVGGASVLAALKLGVHLAWRAGRITDHDALIGRKLAWILAGGNDSSERTISEHALLDLEREAFLSLCGERKTHERIAHTLKTGKTLRN